MKRFILFFFFFMLIILPAAGQRYTDIGVLAGTSMYMGDINPSNFFYHPAPLFGGFFRVNINKRVAVRINGNYGSLSGSDEDFPDRQLIGRNPTSFSTSMVDFNGQVEFNWLPYLTGEDKWLNSIYVSGGIGYTFFTGIPNSSLTIPFGAGFKINITDRLSTGLELSYRKTFTDEIDRVVDPIENTLINNNDWYSVAALFISYKFVKFAGKCPAYN
jgi:hypothetical protein